MKEIFNLWTLRVFLVVALCMASANAQDEVNNSEEREQVRTLERDEILHDHLIRVNVTMILKDGSRLLGDTRCRNLNVSAVFGNVTVPMSLVSSIENTNKDDGVKLKTRAGDVIHGHLVPPVLEINTLIGRHAVEFRHVERIEIAPSSHGSLREFLVTAKTREGLCTEFVKDIPEDVIVGIERVVRSVDTIGSIVSRHDSAPWLYPVKGRGEAPRVFKEDGMVFYPIWGTWSQRWKTGWEWFDEYGTWIRGVQDRGKPHYESRVEYYVVSE